VRRNRSLPVNAREASEQPSATLLTASTSGLGPFLSTTHAPFPAQDLNLSTDSDNQGVTVRDTQGDSQTPVTSLHDLSQVVNAWPRRSAPPEKIKPADDGEV